MTAESVRPDRSPAERIRLMWARHMLATGSRLEAKSRRLAERAEDCRVFAGRHLRKLDALAASAVSEPPVPVEQLLDSEDYAVMAMDDDPAVSEGPAEASVADSACSCGGIDAVPGTTDHAPDCSIWEATDA